MKESNLLSKEIKLIITIDRGEAGTLTSENNEGVKIDTKEIQEFCKKFKLIPESGDVLFLTTNKKFVKIHNLIWECYSRVLNLHCKYL